MTDRGKRRLAWGVFISIVVMFVAGILFEVLGTAESSGSWEDGGLVGDIIFIVTFSLFPIVGLLLATRRPSNAIGWVMLGIGVAFGLSAATTYGPYALEHGLPGAAATIALSSWLWVPTIGIAGSFLLLLFPDGHLPSPRWRWFAWFAAIGMALVSLLITFDPGTLADSGYPQVQNPFGIDALEPVLRFFYPFLLIIPIAFLGSALSLVLRYRRAAPTERLQIRWLASAAVIIALSYAIAMVGSIAAPDAGWLPFVQNLVIATFALIPIAIGIAVLRYRLYEIDVVVRKGVIVAAMTALFTVIYVAIVGGIGAAVGASSTPALSFVAAAVVALLFQPALARARRFADRVVYGKRATPYEVLSAFSERVAVTYSDEDVLPRMAHVVADAVRADRADVWLRLGERFTVSASWPSGAVPRAPVGIVGDELPPLPAAAAFPVEHQGELLGALAVEMPANDPLDPARSKLVEDLASQAGLVLRNVRLTEDLRARFDELKAAQKRLVTAQDQERRRLERNIHDGAQQQLVALAVKLRLAEGLITKEPRRAESMLQELRAETQDALEDLRDLARGIYPPLLADKGLAAALRTQAGKSTIPVEVSPDGVGRHPPEIEAAVYFSVLEALQNVAKYAEARKATVHLERSNGHLTFEVADDGRGFDPASTGYGTGLQGIADRLAALDGRLQIASAPGEGTTVTGRIPLGAD